MAYETGVPSSIEDLVSKLFTFLTGATAAWTQDELDLVNNYGTIHKNNCYVSFRWDASSAEDLAMYQSLSWGSGNEPHQQPNDSGNGDTTTPIDSERRVNFEDAGAFVAYHFYASDAAPHYCHVVVEVNTGVYRHFGFGLLDKIGDWTGGEYCYGHYWYQPTSEIDNPASMFHSFGLDGTGAFNAVQPTIHVESLPGMGANEKWGVLGNVSTAGTDTAGENRMTMWGGARGGLWGYGLAWLPVSQLNLHKPLVPVPIIYRVQTSTPHAWYLLGHQKDVAIVNIKHLSPGDSITIGGDTWMVFPWVKKQYSLGDVEESWNAGIAYKKIV